MIHIILSSSQSDELILFVGDSDHIPFFEGSIDLQDTHRQETCSMFRLQSTYGTGIDDYFCRSKRLRMSNPFFSSVKITIWNKISVFFFAFHQSDQDILSSPVSYVNRDTHSGDPFCQIDLGLHSSSSKSGFFLILDRSDIKF